PDPGHPRDEGPDQHAGHRRRPQLDVPAAGDGGGAAGRSGGVQADGDGAEEPGEGGAVAARMTSLRPVAYRRGAPAVPTPIRHDPRRRSVRIVAAILAAAPIAAPSSASADPAPRPSSLSWVRLPG